MYFGSIEVVDSDSDGPENLIDISEVKKGTASIPTDCVVLSILH